MPKSNKSGAPEMSAEYDFSKGVRGYFKSRIPEGSELKRLTPAQARKWLEARKKSVDARLEVAKWLVDFATASQSSDSSNELVALEMKLRELQQSIQQLAREAGKRADKSAKETRLLSKQTLALFKQLKSDVLQHARDLNSVG